jgi:hypothetical protein
MRIYTIQKLIIHFIRGIFSYFEINNTLDTIKIINHNYDELNKYNNLYHIKYTRTGLIIDDTILYNYNPKEFFTNGIYKTDEDADEYYLISYIDV